MTVVVGDIGDIAIIPLSFTADDGITPDDPTEAALTVLAPDQTQMVYRWPDPDVDESPIIHDSLGEFHVEYPITQSGLFMFRRQGTGDVTAADEGYFRVRASHIV